MRFLCALIVSLFVVSIASATHPAGIRLNVFNGQQYYQRPPAIILQNVGGGHCNNNPGVDVGTIPAPVIQYNTAGGCNQNIQGVVQYQQANVGYGYGQQNIVLQNVGYGHRQQNVFLGNRAFVPQQNVFLANRGYGGVQTVVVPQYNRANVLAIGVNSHQNLLQRIGNNIQRNQLQRQLNRQLNNRQQQAVIVTY